MRNLYEILGVTKAATEKEIKVAYRKLAKRHHPDRNSHDLEAATAKYREATEAYRVLSDPGLREEYDRTGRVPKSKNPDEHPDFTELLYVTLNEVMSQYAKSGAGVEGVDIVARIRERIKDGIKNLKDSVKAVEKERKSFKSALGRIRMKGDKENLLEMLLRSRVGDCDTRIGRAEEEISKCNRALEFLKDVTYEVDPNVPPPVPVVGIDWTGAPDSTAAFFKAWGYR